MFAKAGFWLRWLVKPQVQAIMNIDKTEATMSVITTVLTQVDGKGSSCGHQLDAVAAAAAAQAAPAASCLENVCQSSVSTSRVCWLNWCSDDDQRHDQTTMSVAGHQKMRGQCDTVALYL